MRRPGAGGRFAGIFRVERFCLDRSGCRGDNAFLRRCRRWLSRGPDRFNGRGYGRIGRDSHALGADYRCRRFRGLRNCSTFDRRAGDGLCRVRDLCRVGLLGYGNTDHLDGNRVVVRRRCYD